MNVTIDLSLEVGGREYCVRAVVDKLSVPALTFDQGQAIAEAAARTAAREVRNQIIGLNAASDL